MSFVCELAPEEERADARARVIGSVAHELRTSLMVVCGAADLLLGERPGPLTAEQRALLEALHRHACALASAVNGAVLQASEAED